MCSSSESTLPYASILLPIDSAWLSLLSELMANWPESCLFASFKAFSLIGVSFSFSRIFEMAFMHFVRLSLSQPTLMVTKPASLYWV